MARILYLDDEAPLVLLMTRMLQILGHQVVGHTVMNEAVAAFQKDPAGFDLVITDLAMPGTSGLEFARQLRAIRADIAVAAASGSVDSQDAASARAQGLLDVVLKPNTIDEMSNMVTGLLEKAGTVRADAR